MADISFQRWTTKPGRPIRRYLARSLDAGIIGLALWWSVGFGAGFLEIDGPLFAFLESFWGRIIDGMITLAVMVPIEAALIGTTGTSFGKWLCGIRVTRPDGKTLGFSQAFLRELKVWSLGYAAGLPLISLVTLIRSYSAVSENGVADWDHALSSIVSYSPMTILRRVLIGLVILVILTLACWSVVVRLHSLAS